MCLLVISLHSLEKVCLGFLPIFDCFFFVVVVVVAVIVCSDLTSISCLYILENNPILLTLFANIFSHPVGFCFVNSFLLICLFFLSFLLPWETDIR